MLGAVLDTDFVLLEKEEPILGEKLKLQERLEEERALVTSFQELKLEVDAVIGGEFPFMLSLGNSNGCYLEEK